MWILVRDKEVLFKGSSVFHSLCLLAQCLLPLTIEPEEWLYLESVCVIEVNITTL